MCKVSILMPVYNAEKYLKEAIDSMISQTYTDWEFIIINDGSVDSSKSIIKSFDDKRIHYIENEHNMGVIKTLNKGIDLCKGEYILRMDADDISHPRRIEKQVQFMDTHLDYIMCGTNAITIDNNGKQVGKIKIFTDHNTLKIKLLFSTSFVHPAMIFRKKILQENKYDENWKHIEDYELWTRLVNKGKVANLKEQLLKYRWHGENVSATQTEAQSKLKNEIVKNQLSALDIYPSEEELALHYYTIDYNNLHKHAIVENDRYENVSSWLNYLLTQNDKMKIYPKEELIAFLWCRWFVMCTKQQRFGKLFSAKFAALTPNTLAKVLKYI